MLRHVTVIMRFLRKPSTANVTPKAEGTRMALIVQPQRHFGAERFLTPGAVVPSSEFIEL